METYVNYHIKLNIQKMSSNCYFMLVNIGLYMGYGCVCVKTCYSRKSFYMDLDTETHVVTHMSDPK